MGAGFLPRLGALAVAVAAAGRPGSSRAQECASAGASPGTFGPYVSWSGRFSHVTGRGLYRVRTQREWQELWLRHTGRAPEEAHPDLPPVTVCRRLEIPMIDFTACEVLAVFRGAMTDGPAGVGVHSLVEQDDRILVRLQDGVFQRGPGRSKAPTAHYGIFVLPRSSKPLVLMENRQEYLGQPPVWRESGRLEAAGHGDGRGPPASSDEPSRAG